MGNKKNVEAWIEAKKRCQLNEADIQMAKELGLTPKVLIKNIPSPDQQWKTPVKWWLRDLYEDKFGKVIAVKPVHNKGKDKNKKLEKKTDIPVSWSDLPF